MYFLFNFIVFFSAFLLFLIQPMSANILLPKVGGSPNVWNACTVFFQCALLIGYAYSYFMTKTSDVKKQTVIHSVLLVCAVFLTSLDLKHLDVNASVPALGVIFALLKSIAAPFIILSATSPLLQRWLSLSNSEHSATPYSLYVFSNAGSLLSLLAYPVVIEHFVSFSDQGKMWHFAYVVFVATVCLLCCLLNKNLRASLATEQKENEKAEATEKYSVRTVFEWILYAFVPSSLMLGVTNHISVDIGGLPFLWIIPLSLYLLSFILTFSDAYTFKVEQGFRFVAKIGIFFVAYLFFTQSFSSSFSHNLKLIILHCSFFFVYAVYSHGVLARKKPAAQGLTLFYLCLSVGGAAGGIFNTFIAPHLFDSYAEYPMVIMIAAPFWFGEKKKPLLFALITGLALYIGNMLQMPFLSLFKKYPFLIFATYALAYLSAAFYIIVPKSAALVVFAFFASSSLTGNGLTTREIYAKRNFFGQIRVMKNLFANAVELHQGTTIHGRQGLDFSGKPLSDPAAYYGNNTPVEDFFTIFNKREASQKIALAGLGGGALLCYPRSDSMQDVFEIDGDIIALSKELGFFTYLKECAANANIYEGDARMEIGKMPDASYDLIIFDAFSSHFIPAHLVTKEAVETYLSKLKPNGLILFHISARLFDVESILSKIARETGNVFIVRTKQMKNEMAAPRWGVFGKAGNEEIRTLLKTKGWHETRHSENTPLWTDDFHNLLGIIRNIDSF